MKKLFLLFLGGLFGLWLLAPIIAYFVFPRETGYYLLGIKPSAEEWAKSEELEVFIRGVNKWEDYQKVSEKERMEQAQREGTVYQPPKIPYSINEDLVSLFPEKELKDAVAHMRPDAAARTLSLVDDANKRLAILINIDAEKREQIQDWLTLHREKNELEEEKVILVKQKQRMELFQASLDKQLRSNRELQVTVLEEMKQVQELQEKINVQFVAITENDRAKYSSVARQWTEMDPQSVAGLVENEIAPMDDQTFVKVLSMMDEDAAGAVLEALLPENGAKFSTALTKLRRAPVVETSIQGRQGRFKSSPTIPSPSFPTTGGRR